MDFCLINVLGVEAVQSGSRCPHWRFFLRYAKDKVYGPTLLPAQEELKTWITAACSRTDDDRSSVLSNAARNIGGAHIQLFVLHTKCTRLPRNQYKTLRFLCYRNWQWYLLIAICCESYKLHSVHNTLFVVPRACAALGQIYDFVTQEIVAFNKSA
jgi:hypothetical protein